MEEVKKTGSKKVKDPVPIEIIRTTAIQPSIDKRDASSARDGIYRKGLIILQPTPWEAELVKLGVAVVHKPNKEVK